MLRCNELTLRSCLASVYMARGRSGATPRTTPPNAIHTHVFNISVSADAENIFSVEKIEGRASKITFFPTSFAKAKPFAGVVRASPNGHGYAALIALQ